MGVRGTTLALCLAFGVASGGMAEAASTTTRKAGITRTTAPAKAHQAGTKIGKHRTGLKAARRATRQIAGGYGGGISCVPYARMVTGMAVTGDGGQWWYNAAGRYERNERPQPGSILAFRSAGGMSRGHVAVVSRLISPRHLQIDHANWAGPGIRRGSVMHNVNVVDVSPDNDWTTVRVQVGYDPGSFGRHYATFGFIHNRPAGLLRADPHLRPLTEIAEMPPARR